MKNKWRILKILVTVIILGFLLSFSLKRFSNKTVEKITVKMNEKTPVYFIDEKEVKKIVEKENPTKKIGDIDIPKLEKDLNQLPAVDTANVYLNLNGSLNLEIKQRVPIFRLNNKGKDFYVDEKGVEFPISKNYSHPSMLVMGDVKKNEYKKLGELVGKIDKDEFSKKYFIGISKDKGSYNLLTSEGNYKVELGDLDNIDLKVKGFKAFVEKYLVYQNPEKYSKISVKYDNQIVTTLNSNFKENDSVIAIGNKEIAKAPIVLKKKALAEAQNTVAKPNAKKPNAKTATTKPKPKEIKKKTAEKPKPATPKPKPKEIKKPKAKATTSAKKTTTKPKVKIKIE